VQNRNLENKSFKANFVKLCRCTKTIL